MFDAQRYGASVLSVLLIVTALITAPRALAQIRPDAGTTRQELENRCETPPTPPEATPSTQVTPTPETKSTGPTVVVSAFKFSGVALIDERLLTEALATFTKRTLDFAELQRAA